MRIVMPNDRDGSGDVPTGIVAHEPAQSTLPGKAAGLILRQDRPLVAETPEHWLDADTTAVGRFFVRNNGELPDVAPDAAAWTLRLDGEVHTPLDLTLGELKARFQPRTLFAVLECGGNGRSAFHPPAKGNAWNNGAVGVAEWTGVSLRDVLLAAGLKPSAAYTAHYGADRPVSGEAGQRAISRGVRLDKAMDEHTLLVWGMNGQALPHLHGGPLRLLVPGWAGSASQKWLTRIWIRDREHDGPGMTGTSYRVPIRPMVPGSPVDGANMRVLEAMPVRSIVTAPAHGSRVPAGTRDLTVRGSAWAGDTTVRRVDVSTDFGRTWQQTALGQPRNPHDWQRWHARLALPGDGYVEIWARATDAAGVTQPLTPANWNPQGYGGNAIHRVAVLVG
jgi:DMSO/TMAO reductase YedYZ molybdopterin-dependent catalytic subunit